ncbi:MAG: AI-2E family transporter [Marinilabiliales bacterium]|nr:MAG: AI-2E family transporter [Marinilabiliales bacterium]
MEAQTETGKGVVKYIALVIGVAIILWILWYLRAIIFYILVSFVLSLIGRPVVELLDRVKYQRLKVPRWISALLGVLLIWGAVLLFFRVFVPIIAYQASELANINPDAVVNNLDEPIRSIEAFMMTLELDAFRDISIPEFFSEKLNSVLNIDFFTSIFRSLATLLGNIFIAAFAITFMTFFFLKDDRLFLQGLLIFVPTHQESAVLHAMSSIKYLLMRYFIGILLQITCIIILITAGMLIVGIRFNNALMIGLLVGVFNVIPYIGPVIGATLGIFIGVVTHLELSFYTEMLPLLGLMLIVFVTVQLIDNMVFQPLIYASSVHAHPMEIFLVLMIGGTAAGIIGMFLAIPTYTVIRVFAKEFFNNFKVVKRLTEKI